MALTRNYNIHNILTIQINTQNKAKLPELNFPLSYFEVDEDITDPDIILNIGPFKPDLSGSYVVDHKYYIKDNYFHCSDTANGKASWKLEIIGFERPPTIINFHGKIRGIYQLLAPDLLAQDLALLPMIELALGLRGFMLLHAGGISKNKHAEIFVGRAGSRKTTIIMDSIKSGYRVLGDDRVILDLENYTVHSFPIFPKIFEFIVKYSKRENLSLYHKIRLLYFLREETSIIPQIWENESVKLRSIFYLIFTNKELKNPTTNNKDALLLRMISNNIAELYTTVIPSILQRRAFPNYILAYSYIFPENNWIRLYNNILKTKIKQIIKTKRVHIGAVDNIQRTISTL
ncbi:hypothetical protein [Thermococcus piezophilus]|uniref:Uncharacterized protein n=1 Tax=Thermococcus piezophilus TaxID=1712654 RepID=A0A172WGQ6_9EURY|nr:hypothetical protein [Thermococcus piezophilus]ANF22628.1 hypothetical protein A7C91_05175 [Thermococcus piezophilus]